MTDSKDDTDPGPSRRQILAASGLALTPGCLRSMEGQQTTRTQKSTTSTTTESPRSTTTQSTEEKTTTSDNGTDPPEPPEKVTGRWAMPMGDPANTGTAQIESPPVGSYREVWRFEPKGEIRDPFRGRSPVLVDGTIYIGSRSKGLLAIDARNGWLKWKIDVRETSSPVIDENGNLFFVSPKYVHSVNSDGEQRWMIEHQDTYTGTISGIVNGVLYGVVGRTLIAVNASKKSIIWQKTIDDSVSPPAIGEELLYFNTKDNQQTWALDQKDGSLVWEGETYPGWGTSSAPSVSNGIVYSGNTEPAVFALDSSNGERLWKSETKRSTHTTPAVKNSQVYVSSKYVRSYKAKTGSELWVKMPSEIGDGSPAIAGNKVIVPTKDGIYTYSSDGSLVGESVDNSIPLISRPIPAKEAIFAASKSAVHGFVPSK